MFLQTLAYNLTIAPKLYRLQKLLPNADIRPAGSRYVCNPPVLGTDIDFLIYENPAPIDHLESHGYIQNTIQYGGGKPIICFRKRKVNLILTPDKDYFTSFDTGTHICKRFNIKDKGTRVIVHEMVRGHFSFEDYSSTIDYLPEVKSLLGTLCNGAYRKTLIRAYRAQHGLEPLHET